MGSFMQILNTVKGKAHKNGNQNVTGKAGNMRLFKKKELKLWYGYKNISRYLKRQEKGTKNRR